MRSLDTFLKPLLVIISALALSVAHGQEIDLSKFKLTFSDEFDGDQLDNTKWQAPEMPRQKGSRWVKSLATVRDGALRLGIRLTDDPVLRYDCAAVRTQRDYDASKTMFSGAMFLPWSTISRASAVMAMKIG